MKIETKRTRRIPEPKPEFIERMKKLLGDSKDFKAYSDILKKQPVRSIRCNTLKITPKALKTRLEKKGWKISNPWKAHPEIMIVEGKSVLNQTQGKITKKTVRLSLEPGELGRSLEHLLGYYYIQELASMLPIIALAPKKDELVLDLCSSPGSKTTQMASAMKNTGNIIANEVSLGRIKILASNLERCGVTNTIITKKEGAALCKRLKNLGFHFDKILVDAPCSGEGTLRSSYKTYSMWNIKTVKALAHIQKNLLENAIEILKPGGEIIYSTCTHSPEENELVVDYILQNHNNIKPEVIQLPIKCREGISCWDNQEFHKGVKHACRVYPQDNNTEGFFLIKFKKLK